MPPLPQRSQAQRPQPQRCPACGNEPMKGSKAGEPICKICGSGLSSSPLGKRAMKAAGDQAAAKVQQAMSAQRRQQQVAQAQRQMRNRAIAGARPGVAGMGQSRPQVDPRALAQLAALAQRGGR